MSVGFDRSKVVDAHDLDVGAAGFDDGAQDIAADAAKSVNKNSHRHFLRSLDAFPGTELFATALLRLFFLKAFSVPGATAKLSNPI
jgi:hypothetical protein